MTENIGKNWTHIQNPNFFKLEFDSIDAKSKEYFLSIKSDIKASTHQNNLFKIITIIDFVLFLQNKKINHLNITNPQTFDFSSLMSDVFAFLNHNNFYNKGSQKVFFQSFDVFIVSANKKFGLNIKVDVQLSFNPIKFKDKIRIVNGIKYKRTAKYGYFNILPYFLKTKDENIQEIIKVLDTALNKKEYGLSLPKFFSYLIENNHKFLSVNNKIMKSFMFSYFEDVHNKNQCIYKAKARWNSLVELLRVYFNFDFSDDFKIVREQKNPHTCHIKQENGKYVKTKLLTDIPLEICDDKAIYLLKEKVLKDIELVKSWADSLINEFEQQFTKENINSEDLLLSFSEMKSKYGDINLLNKTVSMAIITRLIIEHPIMTESFIRTLNINSYIELDNSAFLIGYKQRKTSELAEQKVELNIITKRIVKNWILWTDIFREYEFLKTNKKSNELLLACSEDNFKIISDYKDNLVFRPIIQKNLVKYLTLNMNISQAEAEIYTKKITLSKIRASQAMVLYFKTESTSKMAEVLGHENYNPKLLRHYLPEPVLHYYQSRWVKIFQKGIVCEAMKDSDFLLEVSNFQSMQQLDDFLTNHTLKNIPDNFAKLVPGSERTEEKKLDIFISISDENISAMLALKHAVENSDKKELLNNEVFKWVEFVNKLEKEVFSNKELFNFKDFFKNGYVNKKNYNFSKVIYE